jgi:superfamily II DNA/RNA helicase
LERPRPRRRQRSRTRTRAGNPVEAAAAEAETAAASAAEGTVVDAVATERKRSRTRRRTRAGQPAASQAEGRGLTMIFCQTKRACDRVAADLVQRGFDAAAVHGDLGQSQRERALRAFRSGKIGVLVATDVAARGLDVDDVTHVVNYECPDSADTYVHRIGRTGRAGKEGVSVTLIDWSDLSRWKLINGQLDLPFAAPEETYSTSPHFFEALGIPAGTKGKLPKEHRHERAGLDAEELEDIGETGKARSNARGRDRGEDRERPRPRRRDRTRTRTRGGKPVEAGSTAGTQDAAAETAAAPDGTDNVVDAVATERKRSRTRRRTRAGKPTADAAGTTGGTEATQTA